MGGFGSTRPRRATWAGVCLAERLPFVKFTLHFLEESSALADAVSCSFSCTYGNLQFLRWPSCICSTA